MAPPQLAAAVNHLELIAAAVYLVGTILSTVGSIFFLSHVGWSIPGAWRFVIGSLLFVLGACINVLQIIKAEPRITLQPMNLTAVSFVVSSVLSTVASVPYLWTAAAEDREILYGFLAWQYLIGSSLFLFGGIFIYLRAYLVIKQQIRDSKRGWEPQLFKGIFDNIARNHRRRHALVVVVCPGGIC